MARLRRRTPAGEAVRGVPPRSLLTFGPRGEIGVDWRHPAAALAVGAYLVALPLIVLLNATRLAHAWWVSRKERAYLRRRGLL